MERERLLGESWRLGFEGYTKLSRGYEAAFGNVVAGEIWLNEGVDGEVVKP